LSSPNSCNPERAPPPKDALALLNEVSQRYADANSYHIEAVEESTSSNELSRHWDKRLLTAIVMPDGRYRYEGRSSAGAAILVSDGTPQWNYIPTITSTRPNRHPSTIRKSVGSSAATKWRSTPPSFL
jgi:hypothetical protein